MKDVNLNILKSFSPIPSYNDEEECCQSAVESAVAICINFIDDKTLILLGLSTASDDRGGMFCFPGGRVENSESSHEAAVRELYEEAGIISMPLTYVKLLHPIKPNVSFHLVKYESGDIQYNDEFSDMCWFDVDDLPSNIMEINKVILSIIKQSDFFKSNQ